MEWFRDLPIEIQTTLIASIVAVSVSIFKDFVKDIFLWLWKESYEAKKTEITIFRAYSKPLAISAESLFWRLDEVLNTDGRGDFLIRKEIVTDFEDYKFKSTIYRLASLLGWLRAFRKELSYSVIFDLNKISEFEKSITSFKESLADGPHVELKILENVSKIWNVELPKDHKILESIVIAGTNLLKLKVKEYEVENIKELPDEKKIDLCRSIAETICNKIDINMISDDIISETKNSIINTVSIKDSWIFRDWQDGIGDFMLRESKIGVRNFEVIGFYDFENILLEQKNEDLRWIYRIEGLFKDLDVRGRDVLDFRKDQLEKVFKSTALLLQNLSRVESNHTYISPATKKKINTIIN